MEMLFHKATQPISGDILHQGQTMVTARVQSCQRVWPTNLFTLQRLKGKAGFLYFLKSVL